MTPQAKRELYRAGKWLLPSIWAIGTFFSGESVEVVRNRRGKLTENDLFEFFVSLTSEIIERRRSGGGSRRNIS
jgi:hypothetical protein